MSGFRHPVFEDRIAATDVASVLQGIHPLYPHDWLKTRWIQHGGGFQLSKKASLPPGMRTSNANPRHTGTWLLTLKDATQTDVAAFDYISCNGKMACSSTSGTVCSVKLRIAYFGDATCSFFTESPAISHGLQFVLNQKKVPMSTRTKALVEKYAFLIRPNIKTSSIRRILLSEFPDHQNDRSVVPTIS